MMTLFKRPEPLARQAGFTLIELLAAVVIVGILVAVALPAYNNSVRKSRRSDAVNALASIQQAQERYRANNPLYASALSSFNPALPSTSQGGYYTLGVDTAGGGDYIISAQAVSGTSQAADSNCTTMRLQLYKGTVAYGGCSSCGLPTAPATVTDPDRCWSK